MALYLIHGGDLLTIFGIAQKLAKDTDTAASGATLNNIFNATIRQELPEYYVQALLNDAQDKITKQGKKYGGNRKGACR